MERSNSMEPMTDAEKAAVCLHANRALLANVIAAIAGSDKSLDWIAGRVGCTTTALRRWILRVLDGRTDATLGQAAAIAAAAGYLLRFEAAPLPPSAPSTPHTEAGNG